MRKRRYRGDDSLASFIGVILVLGVFGLFSQYHTNRANFWRWIIYFFIFVLVVIGAIFGWRELKYRYKQKKLDHFLDQINKAGLDEHIQYFINSWGLERGKNTWPCRSFHFDWDRLKDFRKDLREKGVMVSPNNLKDVCHLLEIYIQEREEVLTRGNTNSMPQKFLNLSGSDFEKLLYKLFESMGYAVELKGGPGDMGGDLVLNKGVERILVQAKRYGDESVGIKAIQEAATAKIHYNCTGAIVVTTTIFTPEALVLARDTNVKLIPKQQLQEYLLKYLKENWN